MYVLVHITFKVTTINLTSVFVGYYSGLLSAVILLVTSFPDYNADKNSGRRTLVILIGKENSVKLFAIIIALTYTMIVGGSIIGIIPIFSAIGLLSMPFAIKAVYKLRKFNESTHLVSSMGNSIIYSRLCGILLALSFFV